MSNDLQLKVGLSSLAPAANLLKGEILARLSEAVGHVSAQTAAVWQEAVHKAKLWEGERQVYADSISWKMTGALTAEVEATYQKADEIENGRPPRDLKRMLDTSLKVRLNKKGSRYLIIPFRHNTPGYTAHASDMPQHVYEAAKALKPSKVLGMGTRPSGTGAWDLKTKGPLQVPQAKYLWGGRLAAGSMGPNPKGKVDRFAGMYRFDTSIGKKKESTYLTFRVMTETSKGWIVPAQPGLNIAKEVIKQMGPLALEEFKNAAQGVVL